MIQKLLSECTKYVKSTLKSCTKYVDEIFEKKTDSIILELKKQSFAFENQGEEESQEGEEKKEGDKAAGAVKGGANAAVDVSVARPTEGSVPEDEDSEESDSDEDKESLWDR